jgi:cytochrome c556
MANWKLIGFAAVLPIAALVQASGRPGIVVYDQMHDHVAPQAQILWDITNAAMDDEGNPSAQRMKPADWVRLKAATGALSASLERMAAAGNITVKAPRQKLLDEDAPAGAKAAAIQTHIDRNPNGFRHYAQSLARYVRGIEAAAAKRDLKSVYASASELDGMCESCHETFWFPKA